MKLIGRSVLQPNTQDTVLWDPWWDDWLGLSSVAQSCWSALWGEA